MSREDLGASEDTNILFRNEGTHLEQGERKKRQWRTLIQRNGGPQAPATRLSFGQLIVIQAKTTFATFLSSAIWQTLQK